MAHTRFLLLVALAFDGAQGHSTNCDDLSTCGDCAAHDSWFPGSSCLWCPHDNGCHAVGSVVNPCLIHGGDITDVNKCPTPEPVPSPPAPAPVASPFAANVLTVLLPKLNVTGVKPVQCVHDVGRADVLFGEFAADLKAKRFQPDAALALGRALTALSTAALPCGLSGLRAELAVLAAAARVANFSAAVWTDAAALADAITRGDAAAAATALEALLSAWRAVSVGCAKGSSVCLLLDHLLELMGMAAKDVTPCEAALSPALVQMTSAATALSAKNYTGAVSLFAAGLDGVALAVGNDACGLRDLAEEISKLSPKLKAAVVQIETSGAVKIIVGSADVYDDLYHIALDVHAGNLADLGVRLGMLLSKLRASGCATPACIVLEGLLASLQLEVNDYQACSADLDAAWPQFETALAALEEGQLQKAAVQTGSALVSLAHSTTDCGLSQLASIVEATASKLGKTAAAHAIGEVVQVLTEGSDLTLDLAALLADGKAKSWPAFGQDLGNLAAWLTSTGCTSFVCKLLTGLLDAAAIPFQSLTACVSDLRTAEAALVGGAASLANHSYAAALTYWAAGLHDVASSVGDCHLADELDFVAKEAQVLGFGQIKILGEAAQVLVHGADFYDELYGALQAIESHDYRSAGADLGKAMNELSQWTKGHACTSDFCYVVLGIFEYLGDIEGDIRMCESDFELAYHNFSAAVGVMKKSATSIGSSFPFSTDVSKLKQGIRDIGYGLLDVANGVKDCHLTQLAAILEKLATKLGLAPEVQWVETFLKIVIDGVQIEREVGAACVDYSDGNWVGFGYNLAKLVKTLIGEDAKLALELIEQPAFALKAN